MTYFRCPESSCNSSGFTDIEPAAEPSHASRVRVERRVKTKATDTKGHHKKPHHPKDNMDRSPQGEAARRKARQLAQEERQRKKRKEEKARRQKALREMDERRRTQTRQSRTIWVGNLDVSTSDTDLLTVFQPVGRLTGLDLRCAGGYVCPPPPGAKPFPGGSKYYASIVYHDSIDVEKALFLDGTTMHGRKIVVRRDVLELPEFTTGEGGRVDLADEPEPSIFTKIWETIKMRTVGRTLYIPDTNNQATQEHREYEGSRQ